MTSSSSANTNTHTKTQSFIISRSTLTSHLVQTDDYFPPTCYIFNTVVHKSQHADEKQLTDPTQPRVSDLSFALRPTSSHIISISRLFYLLAANNISLPLSPLSYSLFSLPLSPSLLSFLSHCLFHACCIGGRDGCIGIPGQVHLTWEFCSHHMQFFLLVLQIQMSLPP